MSVPKYSAVLMSSVAPTRILIVDDNEATRYGLARCLRQAGYEILEAATGQNALLILEEDRPGLVLLDIELPDFSGLEICRLIKTGKATAGTPVIQISAQFTEQSDRIEGLESGADSYLTIPYEPRELLAQVKALLRLKQAEEASYVCEQRLREHETRLEMALNAGGLAAWEINLATGDVLGSPKLRELFGIGPDEKQSLREHWRELVLEEDQPVIERGIEAAVSNGAKYHVQFRIRRPDGALRWLDSVGDLFPDKDGDRTRLVGLCKDVTESKLAEEALRRSERRLRAFFSSEMVGAVFWNTRGGITEANDKFLRMVGYTRDDLEAGKLDWSKMTPLEYRSLDERALAEIEATGSDTPYEKEFIRKDGTRVPVIAGAAMLDEEVGVAFVLDITERKRAEGQQQMLTQQRQLALDAARMGWWRYDPETGTASWDQRFKEIYGLSSSQGPNDEILALIHPDDLPAVMQAVKLALNPADPIPYSAEYRIVLSDGSVRWVAAYGVTDFEGDGPSRHGKSVVGAVQDITARKLAEQALQESEERFRIMADGLPLMVWVHDDKGNQQFVNKAFCEFFGATHQEMKAGRWKLLMHPDDAAAYVGKFQECLRERKPFATEVRVRRGDGQWRWLASWGQPRFCHSGEFLGMVGASADITERKQSEEATEAALASAELERRRLAAVLDALPVGVAIADAAGKVTHYNGTLSRIWGHPPTPSSISDYRNRKGWWADSGEPLAAEDWAMVRALRTGQVVPGDVLQIEKFDGSGRTTIVKAASPILDSDGKIIGGVVAAMDISAQKQAEAALNEAQAQLRKHAENLEQTVKERTALLQETVAELEQYSYSISHDMRAPLRAMNQFCHIVLEDYGPKLDSQGQLYLKRISAAAVRLDRLINDVLTYHRLMRSELSLEPVDLEALTRDIIQQYPMFQESQASIEVVSPLDPVRANPAALTQCMSNLLGNAVKFVHSGVKPEVVVWTESHGGWVRVWVKDNGIGMESGQFEEIWGIFHQCHGGKTYEGTGIGLSIVKKAVERMGGKLGVESQPGQGSRFWFELEAAPKAP
jgi:PAS domain S-box-containing protein